MRQAFAGMLWGKQLYAYDVERWLDRRPGPAAATGVDDARHATPAGRTSRRSTSCRCPTPGSTRGSRRGTSGSTASRSPTSTQQFAKYQLLLLCREWFQHPNGALPAYEWDFGDVNPPVQAWAALEVFAIDGAQDIDFLERVFDKLLVNFTWWVNLEDADGYNLFEGGFLGLDNIGPIDRSHLPVGGRLEQSDATGWMAFYALTMATIASILNRSGTRSADDLVAQVPRTLRRHPPGAGGIGRVGRRGRILLRPTHRARRHDLARQGPFDGRRHPAARGDLDRPGTHRSGQGARQGRRPTDRRASVASTGSPTMVSCAARPARRRVLLGVTDVERLERVLATLFDPAEFLSPYGLRALSAWHRDHPYQLDVDGVERDDRLRARRVDHRRCSAATRTGGARSGCR